MREDWTDFARMGFGLECCVFDVEWKVSVSDNYSSAAKDKSPLSLRFVINYLFILNMVLHVVRDS